MHNFGRAGRVDRDGIARLVRSLSRLLEPGEALEATAGGELTFVAWVLQLWQRT